MRCALAETAWINTLPVCDRHTARRKLTCITNTILTAIKWPPPRFHWAEGRQVRSSRSNRVFQLLAQLFIIIKRKWSLVSKIAVSDTSCTAHWAGSRGAGADSSWHSGGRWGTPWAVCQLTYTQVQPFKFPINCRVCVFGWKVDHLEKTHGGRNKSEKLRESLIVCWSVHPPRPPLYAHAASSDFLLCSSHKSHRSERASVTKTSMEVQCYFVPSSFSGIQSFQPSTVVHQTCSTFQMLSNYITNHLISCSTHVKVN